MSITLYTNPFSRGRAIHWLLEELAVPYRIELLDFARGQHKTPQFLAINPMGKVPAIVHETNGQSVVVTESAAICCYLADAFPGRGLAPPIGSPLRAAWLRWMFFAAGCLEPAVMDQFFPRAQPAREGSLGYGSLRSVMTTLDDVIGTGWLLGNDFSSLDVYLGSTLHWAQMVKAIVPTPKMSAYVARCEARPSWKRMSDQSAGMAAELQPQTTN